MIHHADDLPSQTTSAFGRHNARSYVEPEFSFVIPVLNEQESLAKLFEGISENVMLLGTFEVIFIDDGSTDSSWQVICDLAKEWPEYVLGIRFRNNRGKAAALQTGFERAKGSTIFTMDADLQDDPRELHRFVEKLEEGYDLVSGWKRVRHDPWHKVLPSRVFNRMLSYFSRVKLHDHNCGFKCYRRESAKSLRLFGELHRMVPALAGMQGFRVAEISVQHHARRFGSSKYGIERFLRGFSDMLTVAFLRKYQYRPSHFANLSAACYGVFGLCLMVLAIVSGVVSGTGLLFALTGLCFGGMSGGCVLVGLISELLIRQRHSEPPSIKCETDKLPLPVGIPRIVISSHEPPAIRAANA